ncbi:UDP-N-acetylmuramoyl-tripeptide--D-alanyl-D-alanine ligase [Azohydromonas sp.]|uniref:UDP-N-acetylmuramoyl-tripeptide--D-alanyl-D- alanine ligase n=1 Tax=Azohydromonas sp. TaxID=1872666 RepID=UPI002D135AD9|nr:UDP-N-acetylmuramoyl-tripeptide--D-alanyl-D-alanine ligase [Azohydromonas sp.]HMM87122.1 UDP-N-acetylmuramoyl-tripeptide--D-alanyl-D-alanine ligase [Azohydromonas sp.]
MTAMATLADAHAMLPHSTLVGDGAIAFARVASDSRSLLPGDLFVALQGERFDGHDFLAQARERGAVAALAERGLDAQAMPGLQVADALAALQQFAAAWRRRMTLPLIAVTGSNGKTTVTQMIAAILRDWLGDAAFATAGNLNNHIGVPLTLLRLRDHHRAGVVELGMNHPGEIAMLARWVQPQVVLVNNAQREHQEFMASVEAVARENGSAIDALGADGVAVYPADDAHAPLWHRLAGARAQRTFALDGAADVVAEATWVAAGESERAHWALTLQTPAGAVSTALHLAGRHHAKNALAAATCALAVGAPLQAIARGLAAFEPVGGRSVLRTLTLRARRVTLVDDSYNANPDSVRAAVDLLAGLERPGALLLGDMGEVGERGPQFHAEVGAYARQRGVAVLWTAGSLSAHAAQAFGAGARHFDRVDDLVAALAELPPAASVLVKGSRFMRMERVVQALEAAQAG